MNLFKIKKHVISFNIKTMNSNNKKAWSFTKNENVRTWNESGEDALQEAPSDGTVVKADDLQTRWKRVGNGSTRAFYARVLRVKKVAKDWGSLDKPGIRTRGRGHTF